MLWLFLIDTTAVLVLMGDVPNVYTCVCFWYIGKSLYICTRIGSYGFLCRKVNSWGGAPPSLLRRQANVAQR